MLLAIGSHSRYNVSALVEQSQPVRSSVQSTTGKIGAKALEPLRSCLMTQAADHWCAKIFFFGSTELMELVHKATAKLG